jgi:anti-anti-sigma factor
LDISLQKGVPRIVVNLASIPLIDSEGLELLRDACDQCQDRGGIMLLAAPNPLCRDILRITSIDQCINTYDDTTEAIRSFSH